MQSIGEALKNAREAKGISLEQAEEDTKIRKRYLQALEDGEYSVIPGGVYVKGFLRNYANYLDLNQEEIMIEYKLLSTPVRENGSRTDIQEVINRRRTNNRINRRAYVITVIVAVIALVTYAFYSLVFNRSQNSPEANQKDKVEQTGNMPKSVNNGTNNNQNGSNIKNSSTGNNNIENNENTNAGTPDSSVDGGSDNNEEGITSSAAVSEPDGEMSADGEGVTVVLRGKDEASWARVHVDGRIVFTGEIKPGDVKRFTGTKGVKFRLGNAGGVEVNLNGQELGTLGLSKDIVDKEYLNE